MPKVIQVIESYMVRGKGTTDNIYRTVKQYHTLEGDLLAELDPCSHDFCNLVIRELEEKLEGKSKVK